MQRALSISGITLLALGGILTGGGNPYGKFVTATGAVCFLIWMMGEDNL